MKPESIILNIENGTIHYQNRAESIKKIEWVEHPTFEGVFLKHMIKGESTKGKFSSHLVRIDPNCKLETHCHKDQWELHEVIEGQGSCKLEDENIEYQLGKMAVIPKGVEHNVQAGNNGLVLLAKFIPALL